MTVPVVLDSAGRRRSPATMPGYHAGRAPRNKGVRADFAIVTKPGFAVQWEEVGVCWFRVRVQVTFNEYRDPRVEAPLSREWAPWSGSTRYRWSNGASASWILSSTPNAITGGGYAEARAAIAPR